MQRIVPVLILLLSNTHLCQAQAERHELGRRLRQFERLWESEREASKLTAASKRMNDAVLAFFAFKLSEAGRALDLGMLELQMKSNDSPSAELRSLWLKTDSHWLDASTRQISLKLDRFYSTQNPTIKNVMALCEWTSFDKRDAAHTRPEPQLYSIPGNIVLAVPRKEGDHFLKVKLRHGAETLTTELFAISITHDRDRRLNRIKESIRQRPARSETIDELSIIHHERVLSKLAQGETLETDYPAHILLRQCEEVLTQPGKNTSYFESGKKGQFWLGIKTNSKGVVTVRVQPGLAVPGKKVPVVLALHGAGGSENLFFDGYGDGKIACLAEMQGWFVVTPRNSLSKAGHIETLSELAKVFPEIDLNNIFIVGHSMGGSEAIREANAFPEKYAAVAVLGGGGSPRPSKDQMKAFMALPFFIGIGEQDFARNQADALSRKLKELGVRQVQFQKYAHIEHMLIVQEALPDVFRFFSDVHKQRLQEQAGSKP